MFMDEADANLESGMTSSCSLGEGSAQQISIWKRLINEAYIME